MEIGYEAYVDFHYVYDFNHAKDNYRPFNSNPVNVNQFGLAYSYAQAAFEYRRMTAKAAFHTGEIVSVMYAGEEYLYKFIRELSFTSGSPTKWRWKQEFFRQFMGQRLLSIKIIFMRHALS